MLDAISEACEAFINAPVLDSLTQIATEATARNGIAEGLLKIVPDDKDKQTLLARYPTATEADAYIPKAVKNRIRRLVGARSELRPLDPALSRRRCAGPRP